MRQKYNGAARVKSTKGGRLKIHKRNVKIPTAQDLLFIQGSPDYCNQNHTIGSKVTAIIMTKKLVFTS